MESSYQNPEESHPTSQHGQTPENLGGQAPRRERRRTAAINAATGRTILFDDDGKRIDVDPRQEVIEAKLEEVHKLGGDRALLDFMVWCGRNAPAPHSHAVRFVDAAEAFLRGETDETPLRTLLRNDPGTCIAAGTIGLKIGDPTAAAYIGAFACVRPVSMGTALAATQMMRLGARLVVEEGFARAERSGFAGLSPEEAESVVTGRQLSEIETRLAALRGRSEENGQHDEGGQNER
jgi:hypothetical protein